MSMSFLSIPTQKKLKLGIGSAASSGGQGKLTFYFPSHPLEAGLSTSMFCLLFTRTLKILFLVYTLLISRWAPKDIT